MQRVTGWGGRFIRRWWPDRNPVRRWWDRVEAGIAAGLVAGFLVGAPLAGLAAEGWAHRVAQHVRQAQLVDWHQVPAVLTATAPSPANTGYMGSALSGVQAKWTAPNGKRRAGYILANPGTKAGSTVMLWVDSAGMPTGPPLLGHQVGEQAVLAAVVSAALLGMVLFCAGWVARRVLDARRMAAWDTEWRVTGPRWSPHR